MGDTPTVFLFQIAAISPQSSFLIWKDKVYGMHFFDMDRFVLTCSEYIKMCMIGGHPTSKSFNKRKGHGAFSYMCEHVCLCVLACVFLCERDVINITLTIVKYVPEIICNCKSTRSLYMSKCPEIPACGHVKECGSLSEWKKLKHALHKIYFFHFLSFLAISLY